LIIDNLFILTKAPRQGRIFKEAKKRTACLIILILPLIDVNMLIDDGLCWWRKIAKYHRNPIGFFLPASFEGLTFEEAFRADLIVEKQINPASPQPSRGAAP
jgi:hypothetical protein